MTTHCITKHQFSVSISQFTPGVQLQEYLNETPPLAPLKVPVGRCSYSLTFLQPDTDYEIQIDWRWQRLGDVFWMYLSCRFVKTPSVVRDEWQVKRCKERLDPEGFQIDVFMNC